MSASPQPEATLRFPETLKILQHPDPVLEQVSVPLNDADVPIFVAAAPRLIRLMNDSNGCGLALPQVGVSFRAFVYAPFQGRSPGFERLVFNPSIHLEWGSESAPAREGCLSVKGGVPRYAVQRTTKILVRYSEVTRWQNLRKMRVEQKEETLKDWEARVFQHECDHLDGICITSKRALEQDAVEAAAKALDEASWSSEFPMTPGLYEARIGGRTFVVEVVKTGEKHYTISEVHSSQRLGDEAPRHFHETVSENPEEKVRFRPFFGSDSSMAAKRAASAAMDAAGP